MPSQRWIYETDTVLIYRMFRRRCAKLHLLLCKSLPAKAALSLPSLRFKHSKQGTVVRVRAYSRPLGFQEFQAPIFLDFRQLKVIRLSALHTSRLYLRGEISLVLISFRG
jgi:hypothetical protein